MGRVSRRGRSGGGNSSESWRVGRPGGSCGRGGASTRQGECAPVAATKWREDRAQRLRAPGSGHRARGCTSILSPDGRTCAIGACCAHCELCRPRRAPSAASTARRGGTASSAIATWSASTTASNGLPRACRLPRCARPGSEVPGR